MGRSDMIALIVDERVEDMLCSLPPFPFNTSFLQP